MPLGVLCLATLSAQMVTVPAAAIDITIGNARLGASSTTTYSLGGATGTPFDVATVTLRGDDVVTFGNAGAIGNAPGNCDLTGAEVTISFPGLPGVDPQTQPLVLSPSCAGAPPSLPACGAGDRLFLAEIGTTNSFSLADLSGFVTDGFSTVIEISVAPVSTNCPAVATMGSATARVDNNAPLPVTITSFTVTRHGDGDHAVWTVAEEFDLVGYSVERSATGLDFDEVGFVPAKGLDGGAGTYATLVSNDDGDPSAITYYRLRAVDRDGGEKVSEIVAVGPLGQDGNVAGLTVYPNPVQQGGGFRIVAPANTEATVEVFDVQGRRVLLRKGLPETALGHELAAGSYTVRLTSVEVSGQCRIVVQ